MNYIKLSAPPKLCELRKAQSMIDVRQWVNGTQDPRELIVKKLPEEGINPFAQAEKNPRKFLR